MTLYEEMLRAGLEFLFSEPKPSAHSEPDSPTPIFITLCHEGKDKKSIRVLAYWPERLHRLLRRVQADLDVSCDKPYRYTNARTGKSTDNGRYTLAALDLYDGDTLVITDIANTP